MYTKPINVCSLLYTIHFLTMSNITKNTNIKDATVKVVSSKPGAVSTNINMIQSFRENANVSKKLEETHIQMEEMKKQIAACVTSAQQTNTIVLNQRLVISKLQTSLAEVTSDLITVKELLKTVHEKTSAPNWPVATAAAKLSKITEKKSTPVVPTPETILMPALPTKVPKTLARLEAGESKTEAPTEPFVPEYLAGLNLKPKKVELGAWLKGSSVASVSTDGSSSSTSNYASSFSKPVVKSAPSKPNNDPRQQKSAPKKQERDNNVCQFYGEGKKCNCGVPDGVYNFYGKGLNFATTSEAYSRYFLYVNEKSSEKSFFNLFGHFCGYKDPEGVYHERKHNNWKVNANGTPQAELRKYIADAQEKRCLFELYQEEHKIYDREASLKAGVDVKAECSHAGCPFKHRSSRPKISPLLGLSTMFDNDCDGTLKWPVQVGSNERELCPIGDGCFKRVIAKDMVPMKVTLGETTFNIEVTAHELKYRHNNSVCHISGCIVCNDSNGTPRLHHSLFPDNVKESGVYVQGKMNGSEKWHKFLVKTEDPSLNDRIEEKLTFEQNVDVNSLDLSPSNLKTIWNNQASHLSHAFRADALPIVNAALKAWEQIISGKDIYEETKVPVEDLSPEEKQEGWKQAEIAPTKSKKEAKNVKTVVASVSNKFGNLSEHEEEPEVIINVSVDVDADTEPAKDEPDAEPVEVEIEVDADAEPVEGDAEVEIEVDAE